MRETAEEIDARAADWAAKDDRGLSPQEARALDAWLAADERHLGAFGRMQAVALHTERAAALGRHSMAIDPTPEEGSRTLRGKFFAEGSPRPSRRKLLAGAVAASVAGLVSVGVLWSLEGDRYRTSKGEVRQVALRDGSVITLNTASDVSVRYSAHQREIVLLHGEALFDVAHDKARPFFVRAGTTTARAVGTRFTVRHLDGEPVQVVVHDGIVEVTNQGAPQISRVLLPARSRAIVPAAASALPSLIAVATLTAPELRRELAWRDGHLAFEGETLAAAAAEFGRYSDTRIIVDDPMLGREEIAGLFRASDPVGFARSVAASLNARTEISEGEVRIIR